MRKFFEDDQRYFKNRKNFAEKFDKKNLWEIIDQWPLYCGVSNLAFRLSVIDLLRSTLDVPGHVVEFGSWKGSNVLLMAKILKIFDPMGSKLVHCFESFEGLKTFSENDKNAKSETQGKYQGSYEELVEVISLYEMKNDVVIHKGNIQDTLPKILENDESLSFSCVYCDTDLYEPTKLILNLIHPRLSKGGIIVLDEWNYNNFPGETIATSDFLKEYGSCYEMSHVKNTRQPSLVLKKIKF